MQRSTYNDRVAQIRDQGHKLHGDISGLMDEIPGAAATAEWNMLMRCLELAGALTSIIHASRHPQQPAVFADFCGAGWGSATASQRCVLDADHDGGIHQDVTGYQWQDAADAIDGVDMVCAACRKPAEPTVSGPAANMSGLMPGWQHQDSDDAITCPASGSVVRVMVAAGNDRIPADPWNLAGPATSADLSGA